MGAPRGKRNASREKVWPGERADKLRGLKRSWQEIEDEANRILGEKPIEYTFEGGERRIFSVTPVRIYGRPFASPLTREPRSTNIRVPLKAKNGKCSKCGVATFEDHPNVVCIRCYRTAAKEKHAAFVEDYKGRVEGYIAWMHEGQGWEYFDEAGFPVRARITPDFVPELLDEIADKELAHDCPFFAIPFEVPRRKKPLYYSHDVAERMANPRPQAERIKRKRPRWKMLRGQWA